SSRRCWRVLRRSEHLLTLARIAGCDGGRLGTMMLRIVDLVGGCRWLISVVAVESSASTTRRTIFRAHQSSREFLPFGTGGNPPPAGTHNSRRLDHSSALKFCACSWWVWVRAGHQRPGR